MFLFTVEERHPAKPDHPIGNTSPTEQLADSLSNSNNDHGGKDVVESTSKLKHDDHHGNSDVHDTTQRSSSSEQSIRARCNTGLVWLACREEDASRVGFVNSLDNDSHHSSKRRSDGHRRNEDTSRDLASIR